MSTRCQIQFRDKYTTAQVYRHWDGYPEGVIPSLYELRELLIKTGTFRGADYAAAQYIFREKVKLALIYADPIDPEDKILSVRELMDKRPYMASYLLGHGIENVGVVHGDEAYIYVVEMGTGALGDESNDFNWTVRISEHCGFPIENAFEKAVWQFEGTLDDACKLYKP